MEDFQVLEQAEKNAYNQGYNKQALKLYDYQKKLANRLKVVISKHLNIIQLQELSEILMAELQKTWERLLKLMLL